MKNIAYQSYLKLSLNKIGVATILQIYTYISHPTRLFIYWSNFAVTVVFQTQIYFGADSQLNGATQNVSMGRMIIYTMGRI
jgi:hypothetical protein